MTHLSKKALVTALGFIILSGCSSSGSDSKDEDAVNLDVSGVQALSQNSKVPARVFPVADVDQYEFTVNDANSLVRVEVDGDALNSNIELSVLVMKRLADGSYEQVMGVHKQEGSRSVQTLDVDFLNEEAGTRYRVHVRDYKDDAAQTTRSDGSSEKYTITWRVGGAAINPNGTKEDGEVIVAGDSDTCYTGEIGSFRDVDWMNFNANNGIYRVSTSWRPYNSDVKVTPQIMLVNPSGDVIRTVVANNNSSQNYIFNELLTAGLHSVVISDVGDDDFDLASHYTVCVDPVTSQELAANDEQSNAVVYDNSGSVSGSLDYSGDVDFYSFNAAEGELINFSLATTSDNTCSVTYEVNILNSAGEGLFSKSYTSAELQKEIQVRAPADDTYAIGISEAASSDCTTYGSSDGSSIEYTLNLDVDSIALADPNEVVETGVCSSPTAMLDGVDEGSEEGKIGYAGDIDCFQININDNDTDYRTLELSFTAPGSHVDYELDIRNNRGLTQTFEDTNASENEVRWDISYLITPTAAGSGNGTEVFEFQVSDLGWDEADTVTGYTLAAKLVKLEEAQNSPDPALEGATDVVTVHEYYKENDEQKALAGLAMADDVNKVVMDGQEYMANDTCFAVDRSTATTVDNVTTISFTNWCSGFIDYYGDSDLYKVNLRALYDAARGLTEPSTNSFVCSYDATLFSPAPGSNVEYAWKFHEDENVDNVIASNEYNGGVRDSNTATGGVFLRGAHSRDVNFFTSVGAGLAELPVYVRVLDIRFNDFDGFHDIPYYMNFSMNCQDGNSP
ncbi:hypothetical protein [Litoribacillus peritrichatus]|uniref:Uncharacterized protein n=1 Tax=Litoribacillus peritrichatus TaxID=718191 RepID=A0ABP7M7A1_9GAMM